jgi:hypothetical protein
MRIVLLSFLLISTTIVQGMEQKQIGTIGDTKRFQSQLSQSKPCSYCTQTASLSEKQKECEELLYASRAEFQNTLNIAKKHTESLNSATNLSQQEQIFVKKHLTAIAELTFSILEKHSTTLSLNREGKPIKKLTDELLADTLIIDVHYKKVEAILQK